jgi:hypothetical protein
MYRFSIVVVCLTVLACLTGAGLAEIPKLINYQGMLTDKVTGDPVSNPGLAMTFRIYNHATSTDPSNKKWEETHSSVEVTDGLFNVILGGQSKAGLNLDFSEDYWLEIEVGGEVTGERLQFTSVGYAYRAERADTAEYAHGGGSGDNDWDVVDSVLLTHGNWGIARCGSALLGTLAYTHVNLGSSCVTGANQEDNEFCTVGGGSYNYAYGSYATVGGGGYNTADTSFATVGGGFYNRAIGSKATVGGGHGNYATGECATVGGGSSNFADISYAAVGGGRLNTASGNCATVAGGHRILASGDYATVGGGTSDTASGYSATVAGGIFNTASGWAAVGGGSNNTASGPGATVGGGGSNTASGQHATVGGGSDNTADTYYATVGGGADNTASGYSATVAGGFFNTANGDYSFAAGRRGKANHNGTFVWADGTDADFASSGNNQFLIRASGGVGIGTADPLRNLHVAGSSFAEIQLERTAVPANKWHLSLWQNGLLFVETDVDYRLTLENGGNVGIGTTDPTRKLDVNGIVRVRSWGSTPTYDVQVNNNGDLCRASSSKRYKKNIRRLESQPDKILNLKPVSFEWKTTSGQDIGLIAEEVHEVIPELVGYDKEGRPDAVRYEMVSLYLLELVKGQVAAIRELKEENEELRQRIEALEDDR